jgi:hypothetical protein
MKVKRDDNGGNNDTNASDMKAEEGKGRVREDSWQIWHRNGTRCPKGTVPIRRSTVHDVLRAKSLYDYGKKPQQIPLSRGSDAPDVLAGNGHEVRTLFCTILFFYKNNLLKRVKGASFVP